MNAPAEATRNLLGSTHKRSKRLVFRSGGAVMFLAAVSLAVYAGVWGSAQGTGPTPLQSPGPEGIPLQINHQGVVMVGGKRFDGVGEFRFALVDPDSGANLWTNDGSNLGGPGMPVAAVPIAVDKGSYSVRLGDTSLPNMTAVPMTVFDDDNVVLRIWFDDGTHGVQLLTPDYVLTSAPYAYRAAYATEASHAAEAAHAATADALAKPELPPGVIVMWSGSVASIPNGWALCDGTNGTPDLRDKFIVGARQDDSGMAKTSVTGALSQFGGSPSHSHTGRTESDVSGDYRGWNAAPGGSGWSGDASRGWHTHTFTTGTKETLPPYYALAFITKL